MSVQKIIDELKALGTEQTKKMWMTHGAQEPCLGVKVEDMKKIQKRIKMDSALALELYDTGIADAMYLAGLIADDAKMTRKDLQRWARTPRGAWSPSTRSPGWPLAVRMAANWRWSGSNPRTTVSPLLAGRPTAASSPSRRIRTSILPRSKSFLHRIARTIHQQANRVRYVMNGFVIAVGCYVKPLHEFAVEIAQSIGKVAVDLVGACKIPFAPDHIRKFEARRAIGKKRKSPKC